MLNNFQLSILKNKNIAWQIIKLYHPEIDDTLQEKHFIYTKYDWIMLRINKLVDIGIKFECNLKSGKKPLHLFELELSKNKFKSWRFCTDSKYPLKTSKDYEQLDIPNEYEQQSIILSDKVNEILLFNNIDKPTAQQMSDYYHQD